MMDWVQALSNSAATALVGAAATDAWSAARGGVLALFRSDGHKKTRLVAEWLDRDAAALTSVDAADRDQARNQIFPAWATRLHDLLQENPELADDVRAWVKKVESQLATSQQSWVQ